MRALKEKEYAVYKGDLFICIGTKQECADFIGVDIETIRFYLTPSYKKRVKNRRGNNHLVVISLDDEED